ncbi:hypothetical protein SPIRO4BDMA_50941 [uncultured spirochete]|uniref:Periplasmic binding protein domain-containing protein n=1 Tax=uncultured spirochete TaxID=156406 RepID=A0A3P3XT47_9SPIR|nr:hypothetical protein SPIRO4BDMA_50941 [uncultured spirochete]
MRLCNGLREYGAKMMRGGKEFRFGPTFTWYILSAMLLSVFLAGCDRAPIHATVDEAFALVYPELSSKVVKEFPPIPINTREGAKNSDAYLPYPLQPGRIEALVNALDDKNRPKASERAGSASPIQIFVTSPAVAETFPPSRLDAHTVGINLLAPADSFFSVEWDSEWAYRELGLIAGYRLASLQKKEDAAASAAILFSRGTGRGQKELDAFTQSFEKGFRLAGSRASAPLPPAGALSVFDVESMGLPGNHLEQVLSALRQAEDRKPRLLVLASGSRLALEKAIGMKDIDIMADVRSLGPDLPVKKIFAAIGENTPALISAIRNLAKKIEEGDAALETVRVYPTIVLSKEAKHIRAIVDEETPKAAK